ncbi:MAG: YdeI/OmpD-associated family protein [Flavobacteriales bacterium]
MAVASLAEKLRVTEGIVVVTVNAPTNYAEMLGKLPKGVWITDGLGRGKHAFIHLFVKNKSELERDFQRCAKALVPDGLLWIGFPKGGSGIQTDLTRDKGWEVLKDARMQWLSLISFDETWTAFLIKNSPPLHPRKVRTDHYVNAAEWVDAKAKTVRIPDDLQVAFTKRAKAKELFEALSFTNRKEYVLWVLSAKREETRADRVKKTVEKLLQGLKNPSGR